MRFPLAPAPYDPAAASGESAARYWVRDRAEDRVRAFTPIAEGEEMADKAMDVYLNDHLAGAMLGSALAEQLREENEGTPLGNVMSSLAPQIEEDRKTLVDLMDRMGTSKNPVKQVTTWLAEKATRPKFSGLTSGGPKVGTFMALENLTLGVEGKVSLWKILKEIPDQYGPLKSVNLEDLVERAEAQRDALERERIAAGRLALGEAAN